MDVITIRQTWADFVSLPLKKKLFGVVIHSMKLRRHIGAIAFLILLATVVHGRTEEVPLTPDGRPFRLTRAVMCENIEGYEPKFVAVAFSIDVGKISCFTSFDGVNDTTYIEHKWFRRDELVTSKRLTIKPPAWSTYSSIQLREADKGPWRVEIWDAQDQLIKTLRFSVTE